jgi:RimJ/RimL family protein N-acetyltransferase
MNAPRRFETARLLLRQPQPSDAEAIFERYAGDAEVTRFLGWPRHRSIRDTEAFLHFSAQQWERWPAGPYLIISRSDGQLLGSTGFGFQTQHEAVTGYVLAKDAWGNGYATEALVGVIDVAARIGVARLYALCHPEHRPSQRVLEKCGFVHDVSTPLVEFPNLSPAVQQEALCYALALNAEGRIQCQ